MSTLVVSKSSLIGLETLSARGSQAWCWKLSKYQDLSWSGRRTFNCHFTRPAQPFTTLQTFVLTPTGNVVLTPRQGNFSLRQTSCGPHFQRLHLQYSSPCYGSVNLQTQGLERLQKQEEEELAVRLCFPVLSEVPALQSSPAWAKINSQSGQQDHKASTLHKKLQASKERWNWEK